MTHELHFETPVNTAGTQKEWGMHNGVVVLAALGLVALSVLLGWLSQTDLLSAAPLVVFSFFSSVGFVLLLAAGSVIGMLVATRMLQAHIGPNGARRLALWGIAALAVSLLLEAGLLAVNVALQTQPQAPAFFVLQTVSNVVSGTMAVGAAMIALAFVGRLRG